jgi:hypothetical protein
MQNHPAVRRIEKRLGIVHKYEPLREIQFPKVFDPVMLPNGWSPPPDPDFKMPDYPFKVARTKNKPNDAVGFLPVYRRIRYVATIYGHVYDMIFLTVR